ncbi:MAG: NADH-ubiquinone oxidoreductase chain J, partial [uncultured Solirubrobacteraceae bacterium]
GVRRLLRRRRRRARGSPRDRGPAQPVLLRPGARRAPGQPRGALPAAAGGVRRDGAGHRLRGRRHGALRLRGLLRRRGGPHARRSGHDPDEGRLGALRAPAVRGAVHRDPRLGPGRPGLRGRGARARLRLARPDRRAPAHQVPPGLRAGVLPAAHRRRGRGDARAPARRPALRRGGPRLRRRPGAADRHGHHGRGRGQPAHAGHDDPPGPRRGRARPRGRDGRDADRAM